MNVLSAVVNGLSKAENFLLGLVTKGNAIAKVYATMGPKLIGAVSAVFYDTVKTVGAAVTTVEDAEKLDVPGTVTLSETTLALVKQVVVDFRTAEADVVEAFKQLNISI